MNQQTISNITPTEPIEVGVDKLNRRLRRPYIFISLILLFTLSCNFAQTSIEPGESNITPLATLTPTPGLPPYPTGITLQDGLADLTSYRISLLREQGNRSVEIMYQRDDASQIEHLRVTPNGLPVDNVNEGDTANIYTVDERIYVQYSGGTGWVSVSMEEANRFIIPDASLLREFSGNIPETISAADAEADSLNEVSVIRYDFQDHAIGNITTQGSVWVDEAGGYVLQYEATSSEDSPPLTISYSLSQINEALDLSLPNGARNATQLD